MKQSDNWYKTGKIDRAIIVSTPYIGILFGTFMMMPAKIYPEDYLIAGLGAFMTGCSITALWATRHNKQK